MDKMKADQSKGAGRVLKGASVYFLRLSIARKMFLGYLLFVSLLVVISVFALTNLNRLNNLNRSILEIDVPVIEASDNMIDAILAQELYVRRYAILKTPEVLKVFWDRSAEFKGHLDRIKSIPEDIGFPLDDLGSMHNEYNDLLIKGFEKLEDPSSPVAKDFDDIIKAKQEKIVEFIKMMAADAVADQSQKTSTTANIGATAFKVVAFMCAIGFLLSIAAAIFVTMNISRAINKLKLATEKISEGDFDYVPDIQNKDEVGDLAQAFVTMAERLKKLEEMYIDASPLTRLPGGVAIENIIKKRIKAKASIAFCLMDLDNFKAYNDHYGYAKGNDMIVAAADIIEETVARLGSKGDFVGHIGGDDYVVISVPGKFDGICEEIVEQFDRAVPGFYDEADRERGYISGVDRHGNEREFPLASISIAVVTNSKRKIKSHIQFGEIAAELKEYAKSMEGSVYVVDHRRKPENKKDRSKVVDLSKKRKEKRDQKNEV